MVALTQAERDGATFVIPAGYSESDFQESEEEIAFNKFKAESEQTENEQLINVWRVPMGQNGVRKGAKLVFLFATSPNEFEYPQLLGKLRDEYGGGFYKLIARNERGQYTLNKTVAIESPKRDVATGDNPSANLGGFIDQFSQALNTQLERQENMFSQMNGGKGFDLDSFIKITTVLTPILAPVLTKLFDNKPPSVASQIKEMMLMREFMQDFSGNNDGGGEGNIYSLLTSTLNNLGPLLGAALAAGQKSGAVDENGIIRGESGPLPKQLGNDKKESQQKQDEKEMDKNKEQFKSQLGLLLMQAKGEADPDKVADFVIEQIPDELLDNVHALLSREDFIKMSLELKPEFASYVDWLVNWRDAMLQYFDEGIDDTEESGQDSDQSVAGTDGAHSIADPNGDDRDPSSDT